MIRSSHARAAVVSRGIWLRFAVGVLLLAAAMFCAATQARADASLAGVHPVLAAKARQIVRGCGSHVISAVRNTRVAGTPRMSLHASGQAVDVRGNPRCIYAYLKGWRGGYSLDYATAPGGVHVHVSAPGSREAGRRFVHRHFNRGARLYAHRAHARGRRMRLASYRG